MWIKCLAVATGGALGSVLRFLLSDAVYAVLGKDFPYGILIVNVLGCLAMGFLAILMISKLSLAGIWTAFVLVGILGGFTTFSTFSMDVVNLMEEGVWGKAMLYVALSLILCLGATALGAWIAERVA